MQVNLIKLKEKIDKEFLGKAGTEKGDCFYKMDDGRKCALGLFIPEGHRAQQHANGAEDLFYVYPELLNEMPVNNIDLLEKWQTIHDYKLHVGQNLNEQKQILFDGFVNLCKEYKIETIF